MKIFSFVIVFIFMINISFSQDNKPIITYEYLFVDEVPIFKNGGRDFYNYINEKIEAELPPRYYTDDLILVSFVISDEGKVCDIKPIKVVTEILKNAVIKSLSEMPEWKPGIKNGEAVRVRNYLFITRVLN